jgi:hypothetical protein
VEQLDVSLAGEAHEPHCLVLHLGDKGLVLVILSSDELSDEIFSVGFGDGLRLTVEDVSQIIVIFRLSLSHFDERSYNDSRRDIDFGLGMDVLDILHSFRLLLFKFFEVLSNWSEAVVDVVFVGVTSLEEKYADKVDK